METLGDSLLADWDPLNARLATTRGRLIGVPLTYRVAMHGGWVLVTLVERPYQPISIAGDERKEWVAYGDDFNQHLRPAVVLNGVAVARTPKSYAVPPTNP